MQYRKIDNSHYAQPVEPVYEEKGLFIDANDSVFEKTGFDKYLKIGYLSLKAKTNNMVNREFNGVPYIGLGLGILNIFFPAQGKDKSELEKIIVFFLELILFLAVAYGLIVGWVVNSICVKYLNDKIIKFIDNHKNMRKIFPNYWYTGRYKYYALFQIGLPVFLVLFLIFLPFTDNYNGIANAMVIGNGISAIFGIISLLINLYLNSKDHI